MRVADRILARLTGRAQSRRANDNRHIRATATSQYWRVELVGLSGIGKTYFNSMLAKELGEHKGASPSSQTGSVVAMNAFDEFLKIKLAMLMENYEKGVTSLSTIRRFLEVFEHDLLITRQRDRRPVITSSGVLWWAHEAILQVAQASPSSVKEFFGSRLVIYCTSANPAQRSYNGLVRRGTTPPGRQTSERHARGAKKEAAIRAVTDTLTNLGVPVLILDLDRDFSELAQETAFFLKNHGIRSRKISRLAKRASVTTPRN